MSSRVEKGGQKFKPILRAKTRPSATPVPTLPPQIGHVRTAIEQGEHAPLLTGVAESIPPSSISSFNPTSPIRKEVTTNEITEIAGEEETTKDQSTRAKRGQQTQDHETSDTVVVNVVNNSEPEPPSPLKKRRRATTVEPEKTPEPVDPTQVTMRSICDDPGMGRKSSRWESSKIHYVEARKRAREERARAIAEADERRNSRMGPKKGTPKPKLPGDTNAADGDKPDEFTYAESLKASHYAPQVRIGANGEVVLDMDSLQVDRAADPEFVEETYSHIEESDQSRFTNSSSWSTRRIVRWGKEDTALFYEALRQFGQNFDLISRVLPGKTYKMCKNKFKAEDKKNPSLINDALNNHIAVDLNALSRLTGKDFSGPTPAIEARKHLDLSDVQPSNEHEKPPNNETNL